MTKARMNKHQKQDEMDALESEIERGQALALKAHTSHDVVSICLYMNTARVK